MLHTYQGDIGFGLVQDLSRTCLSDRVWLRTLEQDAKPRWRLVEGDSRSRLRPIPKPPGSAPERPWKVFPELAACDVVPYDVEAPCLRLSDKPGEWPERELESLLSRLDGLFVDVPSTLSANITETPATFGISVGRWR